MLDESIFKIPCKFEEKFVNLLEDVHAENQSQTADVFSEKWTSYAANVDNEEQEKLFDFQKEWYLKLYGFDSVEHLQSFLQKQKIIFDAGCGLGYLSEWFAKLAPQSCVIGMDISDAAEVAAKRYAHIPNVFFIKGDIAKTPFKDNMVDYVNCHAVIMHTEVPEDTFSELARISRGGGQFSCYAYAKKALPRELVDDYFRIKCKHIPLEDLKKMSEQLSILGKRLQELKVNIEVPDIPLLDIKGGTYDIQRFIYWNFLKCFYNEELGFDTSVATNFDWYSPSNAKRYSESEFKKMGIDNHLKLLHFHAEEACFGARFEK